MIFMQVETRSVPKAQIVFFDISDNNRIKAIKR
ncbi:MAG: hypothetical protein K0Q94_2073 [Paenibacillus sp.]|jgi:hypothetical protein|nr:hypothetical protein [Paenibacillus sp.]